MSDKELEELANSLILPCRDILARKYFCEACYHDFLNEEHFLAHFKERHSSTETELVIRLKELKLKNPKNYLRALDEILRLEASFYPLEEKEEKEEIVG